VKHLVPVEADIKIAAPCKIFGSYVDGIYGQLSPLLLLPQVLPLFHVTGLAGKICLEQQVFGLFQITSAVRLILSCQSVNPPLIILVSCFPFQVRVCEGIGDNLMWPCRYCWSKKYWLL